jgi:hypothetical protein
MAGRVVGVGSGEVKRLLLSPEAVNAIIEGEINERLAAAVEYESLRRIREAEVLRLQVDLLAQLLETTSR